MSNIITFVTTNALKVAAVRALLAPSGLEVVQREIALVEPQAESIEAVARYKAQQAFEQVGTPVLVEDSGFCIDALNGFPGAFTKYVLAMIGVEGLLRVAASLESRVCRFVNVLVYVDAAGAVHAFVDDSGVGMLAQEADPTPCAEAWSPLWRVFIPAGASVPLNALNADERRALFARWQANAPYARFGTWLRASSGLADAAAES